MFFLPGVAILWLHAAAIPAGDQGEPVDSLIRKLGSSSFQQRTAAAEALKKRPEAEQALRAAMPSADLEARRRAEDILDFYDRGPLRELEAHAKAGRVSDFVRAVAEWPAGKYDKEIWFLISDLARMLKGIHEKKGGHRMEVLQLDTAPGSVPFFLTNKRVTEATRVTHLEGVHFVRAAEVDVDRTRTPDDPIRNDFGSGGIFVASGTVRLFGDCRGVIFAGGSVRLSGANERAGGILVVSGGDVELRDCTLYSSLIIARGNVTSTRGSDLGANRIIGGKKVALEGHINRDHPNIISENDNHPLGFICWANAPKDKDAPKTRGKAEKR